MVKIHAITVSSEEKAYTNQHRGTFISWTLKDENGWSVKEAHEITAKMNKEITKHTVLTQLCKGQVNKDDALTYLTMFDTRLQKVLPKIIEELEDETPA